MGDDGAGSNSRPPADGDAGEDDGGGPDGGAAPLPMVTPGRMMAAAPMAA